MVLAMYARSGADHYCTFWTADSITAVTAGRLQTDKKVQARTVTCSVNLLSFAICYCLNTSD